MKKVIYYLLFKLLLIISLIWSTTEVYHCLSKNLINSFIRYVYIPLFHSNLTQRKIVKDLQALEKKPTQQITFVYQIRSFKSSDIRSSALKICHYAKIIERAINPQKMYCYLQTSFVKNQEIQDLKEVIINILFAQNCKLKIVVNSDFNYRQKINTQKTKSTPLVIVFSSYPSILGLHPSYLVGSEISFKPQILKSIDYDLYSSLISYAASEQRKGK